MFSTHGRTDGEPGMQNYMGDVTDGVLQKENFAGSNVLYFCGLAQKHKILHLQTLATYTVQ